MRTDKSLRRGGQDVRPFIHFSGVVSKVGEGDGDGVEQAESLCKNWAASGEGDRLVHFFLNWKFYCKLQDIKYTNASVTHHLNS